MLWSSLKAIKFDPLLGYIMFGVGSENPGSGLAHVGLEDGFHSGHVWFSIA